MEAFVRGLPKAELHIHIEGTLEPSLQFALASKHGIELPYTIEELKQKRRDFSNLQDFLDLYYAGCDVLRTEEDFYALCEEYLQRAIRDGVKYVEMFFDPQTHTTRGVAFATVVTGLARAIEAYKGSIEAHLILSFLRHLPEESALEIVEMARPFAHLIWGVGLDSGELGNPARKFKRAYEAAEKAGLCGPDGDNKTAHGGEEGDPSYVIEALVVLKARRIDHGVRSLEDPYLIQVLRDNRIPLTVCPLSNHKLKVVERFLHGKDPVLLLHEAGLCISVNSDDPAYFGDYVAGTMIGSLRAKPLQEEEIRALAVTLARNSFMSAFMPEHKRTHYLAQLEAYLAA